MESASVPIFADLAPAVRRALRADAVHRSARGGEYLVRQGDDVDGVFLVTRGVLRVFALHGDGREATLYRVEPHELCLLSLNSTFSRTRYPAWVSVESSSASVEIIPGRIFRQLLPVDPGVQKLVLGSLTATVAHLLDRLDEALLLSMRDRILRFLSRHAGADGCVRTSHQEIAVALGSSREVVSRELARLKKARRVTTSRRLIRLGRLS